MKARFVLLIVAAMVVTLGPPAIAADPIVFTGNVDVDFYQGGVPKPGLVVLDSEADLGYPLSGAPNPCFNLKVFGDSDCDESQEFNLLIRSREAKVECSKGVRGPANDGPAAAAPVPRLPRLRWRNG